MSTPSRLCSCLLITSVSTLLAAEPPLKSDHFDRDPGWEGVNNHVTPKKTLPVRQDFGYSATKFASKSPGEIGGAVQRCTTPASYAASIPAKTLEQKFSASGTFAVQKCQPGAGLFFGFFNSQQPGGSGRPIGSLGMDFDFEGSGGRLAVRLISSGNKSCGTFITPYLPGKYRPTPIRRDGTQYRWTLDYDPQGANGAGRFTYTIASDQHPAPPLNTTLPPASQAEAKARFPYTTTFTVDVTPELRREGATFDRFGLSNAMKAGGTAEIYFGDLTIDGQPQNLSQDPNWVARGNRVTFEDREQTGAHDFGFSASTSHAGGQPGEVGGSFWRSGDLAWYADKIGPLDLQRRLEARGKARLVTAGPDSDMSIGWFNSQTGAKKEDCDARDFVGIHVGGPTRVGHYFIPQAAASDGTKARVEHGPVIKPGVTYDWSIVYDPNGNNGSGEVRVTLGQESSTLALKPGVKQRGARLDRFGLFTSTTGGQMVKIFVDDLEYTAAP